MAGEKLLLPFLKDYILIGLVGFRNDASVQSGHINQGYSKHQRQNGDSLHSLHHSHSFHGRSHNLQILHGFV